MLDLSCRDWESRLAAGRSLVPDLPIDTPTADRAVAIFNKLRLADVHGTPTMGEAGGDWFRDIVRALFGSLDPVLKKRLIRELFLLVPKKNSKTTNGALLMLTALLMNARPNASLIMTAPVRDVAQLAFDAAAGAVELDDVLKRKLRVVEHRKMIIHRDTKAELAIMSFDPAALTGQKPVAVLIDELHVVAKMAHAPSAIRQLRGGMIPFPEAFLAFITTQSEEEPVGVMLSELTKARAIRDGRVEGAMLPVLYEFPESVQSDIEAWKDSAIWPMVTPNVGRSITIDRLEEGLREAEITGEAELRAWASQHLNIQIGLSLKTDAWAGALFWSACATKLTLDDLIRRSEVVVVGIDGGGLDDMLGLAVLGREADTGAWLLWTHAWIHPIVLERRKKEAERFRDFERQGDLTIVEKIGEDVDGIADVVERLEREGVLERIGADQAAIGAIVDAIVSRGIEVDRIVGISQGWRMVGAIKTTERKLAEGALLHGGQPLMSWCVGNAKPEARGNSVLITKQGSGSAKIDPLMATYDAVTLLSLNPESRRKTYEIHFI